MDQRLLETLRSLNRWVAVAVGLMLLACAGFVLLDIILRQVGTSFGGTDEISGYVMAIATSWGMAFTLLELGHVRIDLIRSRVGDLGRSLFDLFSMVVLSATIVLIAIRCWPVVETSLSNASRANTVLATPLIWVQGPWFAGWVWFALMSCIITLIAAGMILRGRYDQSEAAIGAFAEVDSLQ
ncbi:TRAP transporter small permease subunit [Sulfitobacter sabulilitoris]|uniref:TRAP transporter small permease protein n=1 Tax=Sulfitobacter sabulilitoris TaxID=2562655 RepID=A0A5S3PFP5_9RHOB|nr:TRAP transporter small permease subunit [Sulfitobacter sabulilitoris]TMM52829.1 TRAP transporter small permease [Sulfitobacter sabulilitoris]